MAYNEITDLEISPEQNIVEGDFTDVFPGVWERLRDNMGKIFTADAGAPLVEGPAFDNDTIEAQKFKATPTFTEPKWLDESVTNAKFDSTGGSEAVKSGNLKTTFEQIKVNANDGTLDRWTEVPNLKFMFGYLVAWDGAFDATRAYDLAFGGSSDYLANAFGEPAGPFVDILVKSTGADSIVMDLHYFQGSPPYNLGNGDIPLFIFADIAPGGEVQSLMITEDPPWCNGGPTNIHPNLKRGNKKYRRQIKLPCTKKEAWANPEKMEIYLDAMKRPVFEEIEITRQYKNTDAELIPHPFRAMPKNHRKVLIDPCSKLVERLYELKQDGQSVAQLFSAGYIDIQAEEILKGCKTPNGLLPVRARLN